MADVEMTVYGPGGTHLTLRVLVDTGDTQTVLPERLAQQLNLPRLGTAPVQTNNGTVPWTWSKAWISVRGLHPVEVPVWIAPDSVDAAVGEVTLAALGAKLVFPPPHYEETPPHPETGGLGVVTAPPRAARRTAPSPGLLGKMAANLSVCAGCVNRVPGTLVDICGACGCPTRTRALTSCPLGYF